MLKKSFMMWAMFFVTLIISSLSSVQASVSIVSSSDIVYDAQVNLGAGAEMLIDLTDYPSGAYTIYIMYNGSVWEGEFDIQ